MTPERWWETTLGSLAEGPRGFRIGPFGNELRAAEYLPGDCPAERGVPVIMPKDFAGGTVSVDSISRVPAAKADDLARHRVRSGDVLFARRGEIGRCVLIGRAEDGWVCGTGCVRVRLRPAVEPRFLIQYLRWRSVVSWLEDHAVGQTMPSVNSKILARLPVRLPKLAEQRKLARVLESVDAALRSARAVVEQTGKLRDAVLRKLLGPGDGPAASSSLKPDCGAPPDWRTRSLGQLCTFSGGRRWPASEWSEVGLPILRIRNLNGSREFRYFAGYAKPSWLVEPGELLYAWAGTKGVSFGPCLWDGPRGVLNQHIFRVRPREEVSKVWLYEVLRQVTRHIEDKAHGFKDSLVHVRKKDITGQRVWVPPYEEQRRIAKRSRQLGEQEALERSTVERTLSLRRGLMDDLFEGSSKPASRRGRSSSWGDMSIRTPG